jgi:two-component system chemotaxis sensor kinase CheA
MDEIVQEFLVECAENLDQLDRDLAALETEPGSRELLSSTFRTVHTIKGTSGSLGFPCLEELAHVGENLLTLLRDGELDPTPERVGALLRMGDVMRGLLHTIEVVGTERGVDLGDVVADLTAVAAVSAEPDSASAAASGPLPMLGELLVQRGASTAAAIGKAIEAQLSGDSRPLGEILVASGAASRADVEAALEAQRSRGTASESSVRVPAGQLDRLTSLVRELGVCRSEIAQHAAARHDVDLLRMGKQLGLVAAELQDAVQRTRMQPVDDIWARLPRVVRDLSATCGKQVSLEMDGGRTEIDRALLEALRDPLTHVVRNAIDHGIETPAARAAAGKPPTGTLRLRAWRDGDRVFVEIDDDGAGIDRDRVVTRAVQRGLVGADEATKMSADDVLNFVFSPGFSTAEKVTTVSGRGVGMDVVRTKLEDIGGTVALESVPHRGTTVRLTVPAPQQADGDAARVGVAEVVTATVGVTGSWEGEVAVRAPEQTAVRLGAAILGVEPTTVNRADLVDAMGELANVIGGSVNALLASRGELSLPRVHMGPAGATAADSTLAVSVRASAPGGLR